MKFKFTPEMFEFKNHFGDGTYAVRQAVADTANAILQKHLEGLPLVYNYSPKLIGWFTHEVSVSVDSNIRPTKTAILWDCEPIEGEKNG